MVYSDRVERLSKSCPILLLPVQVKFENFKSFVQHQFYNLIHKLNVALKFFAIVY